MERGARGLFHKLFCALCPTFEKLFRGIVRTLRRAPNFYEIDPWFNVVNGVTSYKVAVATVKSPVKKSTEFYKSYLAKKCAYLCTYH